MSFGARVDRSATFVFRGLANGEFRVSNANGGRLIAVPPNCRAARLVRSPDRASRLRRNVLADPRYETEPRTAYVTDPVLAFSIGKARDMGQPSTDEPH